MKYDQYFIFETPASPQHQAKADAPWIPLLRMDSRVRQGAFYFECVWITEPIPESKAFKPHSHDCDEYLGFFGSDIKDPFNLHAEIEFWFDDEKHVFNRNCLIYVPAETWHTPVIIKSLEYPIFCLSTSPVTKYTQKINRDPRWSHLPDPIEGTA